MSNTIGYSIPKCSTGESFNFSNSAYNDVIGNQLISPITQCRQIAIPTHESIEMAYVSSGAIPTLIGFSEFADASTPPVKYLNNTIDIYVKYYVIPYPSCDCADSVEQTFYYGSGVASYDPITGSTTPIQVYLAQKYGNGSCTFGIPIAAFTSMGRAGDDNIFINIKTKTTCNTELRAACYRFTTGANVVAIDNSRSNNTLSVADTEDNAIYRASWTTGNDNVAQRTARTTGFSFTYIKVTPTAVCTGLDVGSTYTINYTVKSKNLSTNVSTYATGMNAFQATGTSKSVQLPELDPESGFSCEITTYSITKN